VVDLNGKIAVAIRGARSVAGCNQQEFADFIGVAKTTIARIETLEMKSSAEFLLEVLQFFKAIGIEVDIQSMDGIVIRVSNQAINTAISSMTDVNNRRSDRKKT
jgi:DNA-binding XRE family transcriptional regulator